MTAGLLALARLQEVEDLGDKIQGSEISKGSYRIPRTVEQI